MESNDKIIKPNTLKTIRDYKFRISYDNGANETVCTRVPPSLDPNLMMFMNFVIGQGKLRQVNLNKVRYMDVEIMDSNEMKIIT